MTRIATRIGQVSGRTRLAEDEESAFREEVATLRKVRTEEQAAETQGEEYRILTVLTEAICRTRHGDGAERAMDIGHALRCAENALRKLHEAGYEVVRERP